MDKIGVSAPLYNDTRPTNGGGGSPLPGAPTSSTQPPMMAKPGMVNPTTTTPQTPQTPTQGANPNAQHDQYGNPINPYDASHTMPMLNGIPIGAYGAQWGGSGFEYDPSTDSNASAWLNWMKQSDPSAHFQQVQNGGSDGGGSSTWEFQQDHPGAEGIYPQLQQAMKPMGGGIGMENVYEGLDTANQQRHGFTGQLTDPNMLIKTPFGQITPGFNNPQPQDFVDKISNFAPMIMAGLATMMSGGAASPLLISLMTKAPGLLSSMTNYMQQRHQGGG